MAGLSLMAYESTAVSVEKSQGEIRKLLYAHGARNFSFSETEVEGVSWAAVDFIHQEQRVRMRVPLKALDQGVIHQKVQRAQTRTRDEIVRDLLDQEAKRIWRRWAFFDRFKVPQYDGDGNYLTRWRIVQTPWFGILLHRFDGPDPRLTLHDHPWPFVSFVLRGGYVERRLDPLTMKIDEHHLVRRFNRMRLCDAHAIRCLLRVPTWTLMVVGRRVRTWGYLEQDSLSGWLWTEFDKHWHNAEFEAALARRRAS